MENTSFPKVVKVVIEFDNGERTVFDVEPASLHLQQDRPVRPQYTIGHPMAWGYEGGPIYTTLTFTIKNSLLRTLADRCKDDPDMQYWVYPKENK